MKRLLLLSGSLMLSVFSLFGQGTINTFAVYPNNNGSSAVSFEIESTTPINITDIAHVFSASTTSSDVWIRIGGIGSPSGSLDVTAANGWVLNQTATISGGGSTPVPLQNLVPIEIPANTPVGVVIAGGMSYSGTSGTPPSPTTFTDGPVTFRTGGTWGYGGTMPSLTFNPRGFLGTLTYELGVQGSCTPFSDFVIDSISANAAKVDWTPGSGNSSFYMEHGPAGFTPGTGTAVTGTYPGGQPPVIITGLSPQTTYDVYFGEICNSGADSVYFPTPQQFTTTKLCASPTNFAESNLTSTSVDLSWNQAGTAQEYWVFYDSTGFNPSTGGSIDTVTTTSHTLTGLTPITGYDIYLTTNCAGGNGISDTIGPISLSTPIQGPQGVTCTSAPGPINIFVDEFDQQAGWTGDIGDGNDGGEWNYGVGTSTGTGPSGPHSGSGYVYFEASGAGPASLVSPAIDLSSAVDAAELAFWIHAYGGDIGYLRIMVSNTSAAGPFNDTIFNYTNGQLQSSDSDPWQQVGVDLSAYLGQTIYLEFEADRGSTGFEGDISLDLLQVTTCGDICVQPSTMGVDSISQTTADLSWTENGSATQWDIEFGTAGFSPTGTPTYAGVTSNPYRVTGLNPATPYEFYVRAICGGTTGNSPWVGPYALNTLIQGPQGVTCNPSTDTSTVILEEEFDSEGGWTGSIGTGSTNGQWNYGTSGSSSTGPSGPHSGSGYIYFEAGSDGPAVLISPAINLVYAVDGAELAFWLHAYGDDVGYLNVSVSTNSAQGPFSDTIFNYNGQLQSASSDPWQQVGVNLDNYLGQTIWLRFEADRANNSFAGDIALDLLTIEACGTFCLPEIYSIQSLTADTTSALVDIDTGSSNFQIEWGPCGYTQGTGSFASGTSPFNITGLSANTCYDVYVRRDCSPGGFSGWAGPFSVNTLCDGTPIAAPFIETFDGPSWVASGNNADNEINSCWTANPDMSQGSEPFKWMPRTSLSSNGPNSDLTGGNFMYVEASSSTSGDIAYLSTPRIDVQALANPALFFWQHRYSGGNIADLNVEVSNDDGASWSTVYSVSGDLQSGETDPWQREFADLAAFTDDTIIVRFKQTGNGCCGDGAIDSIAIDEAPTCWLPQNLLASGVLDTFALLEWMETIPAGSFEVWHGPSGFYQGPGTIAGTRVITNGDSLELTDLLEQTDYEFLVRSICSPGDTSDWFGPVSFTTNCSPIVAPYLEDFETASGTTPPACWLNEDEGGSDWEFDDETGQVPETSDGDHTLGPGNGGIMAWIDDSDDEDSTNLLSPFVDISPLSQPQLSFWMWSETNTSGTQQFPLHIDVHDGSGWVHDVAVFDIENTQWQEFTVNLEAFSGIIQVRFSGEDLDGDFYKDIAIDDVSFDEGPICPQPSGLVLSNVRPTSIDVSWDPVGNASSGYVLLYDTTGFDPNTGGNTQTASSTSASLSGLSPNTSYDVYIYSDCGTDGVSDTSFSVSATTPCLPEVAPYLEDFEQASGTTPPSCWTNVQDEGGSDWEFDDETGQVPETSDGDHTLGPGNGGIMAWLDDSDDEDSTNLLSPLVDISALSSPQMSFWMWSETNTSGSQQFPLHIDVNDGSGWVQDVAVFDIENTGWQQFSVNLAGFGDTVQVRFSGEDLDGDFYKDIAIDDVSFEEAPACPMPSNLNISNVLATSMDVSWDAVSNASSGYIVLYGITGFDPATGGSSANATSNSTALTGLSDNSTYDVYVVADCAADGFSDTTYVASATTKCLPIAAPYLEDFEQASGTTPPSCWINVSDEGGADWEFGDETGQIPDVSDGDHTLGPGNGGIMAHLDDSDDEDSTNLLTPLVDISGLGDPQLSFWMWSETNNTGSQQFPLHIDVNDGSGWVKDVAVFDIENTGWEQFRVSLAQFGDTVQVRFSGEDLDGDFYKDIAIDDVLFADSVTGDLNFVGAEFIKGLCLSSNDSVMFEIYNEVGPVVNFASEPLSVTYTVNGPVSTSGTFVLDTGSLASLDTMELIIDGIDLSVPGNYVLNAYMDSNSVNTLIVNDTLSPSVDIDVLQDFGVTPQSVLLTNPQDTVEICVETSFFGGGEVFFSEISHYSGFGTGAGTTPSYLPDDYVEVTGIPNSDLDGITFEQWEGGNMISSHTFGSGTLIGPNGTAIIMIGSGAGPDEPSNYMYNGLGSGAQNFSSPDDVGRILRDANGNIVDAVGYNAYSFPSASGVTTADWSGQVTGTGTTAGIRLIGPDNNSASDWVVVSASVTQDANVLNSGVPLPSPQTVPGFTWTLNGVVVDSASCIEVDGSAGVGTHYYVANYTNVCGTFTDTVAVTVPNCPAPQNFTGTALSASSVELTWDTLSLGGATFELQYGPSGFALGTGTSILTTDNSDTATGLASNLCQEYYVRALCGATDSSAWIGPVLVCPEVQACDDLDAYATGNDYNQSILFRPWQNGGAAAWGDAEFSSTRSASPSNSLHITDQGTTAGSDVVAFFDTYSNGAWEINFDMFVESGSGGYVNIQQNHAFTSGTNLWGGEIYFQGNGTASVEYGTSVAGTFTYAQNQWVNVSMVIDLDNDSVWVEYNNTTTGIGWDYSASNPSDPLQFNGVNFFSGVKTGLTYNIDYYVDNFCVTPRIICSPPSSLAASALGCDTAIISWNSTAGNQSTILEYGPTGFTPGTSAGTVVAHINSPYTITGLTDGTGYDVYVMDTCAGDTTAVTGPFNFSTLPGPCDCDAPTALMSSDIGCDTVVVNWSSTAGSQSSILEYGPTGFTPGAGTAVPFIDSPHTLTGLDPATAYDFYVSDTCGTDTSQQAGPETFTTLSSPVVAAFTISMGTATATDLPVSFDGNTSQNAVSYDWDFGDNNTGTGVNPTHNYTANGTYVVELIASGACGTDTITDTVVVQGISLAENALGRSLSVYPNPTHADVTVEFDPQGSSEAVLRLMDIRGREIIRSEYDNLNGRFREELSLNGLAKGIYMIEIRSGDMRAYRRVNLQ